VASGSGLYAAAAALGSPAVGWKSTNGATWTSTGTLDPTPAAVAETTSGSCPTAGGAVAVGHVLSASGSVGLVWPLGEQASASNGASGEGTSSTTSSTSTGDTTGTTGPGRGDKPGTLSPEAATPAVLPTPPVGSDERLLGCSSTNTGGLVAWGASASTGGVPEGAVWTSPSGTTWTRLKGSAFSAGGGTAAITDLATNGTAWLAVTGSSTQPWTEDTLSSLGIWQSSNSGQTWQEVPTTGAPWTASFGVSASQVAYFGIDAVVAGQVDGRLAVWVGTTT
jgi:hypothetical protein